MFFNISILVLTIIFLGTAIFGLIVYINYNFRCLNKARHRSERTVKLEIIQALNSTNDPNLVKVSRYLFDRLDK